MELRHLRYFVIVAEEQNVTRAAQRLNVSQPPLSRQIRDLENELDVQLFRRTAKSLALTEEGKIFLAEARAVLLRAEQAVQTVKAVAKGQRGQLRVGYAPSLTVEFLPRALKLFEKACPGVRVTLHDLSTTEYTARLKSHKIDIALAPPLSGGKPQGFIFERIASYALMAAVPITHPLAAKRTIPLNQFKKDPLLVYSEEDYPEYMEWLRHLFRPHGIEPRAAEEYDSASSLISAVEAERGIALVTSSMRCMAGPRLKILPLRPALSPVIVGAVHLKPTPEWVPEFLTALKTSVSQAIHK